MQRWRGREEHKEPRGMGPPVPPLPSHESFDATLIYRLLRLCKWLWKRSAMFNKADNSNNRDSSAELPIHPLVSKGISAYCNRLVGESELNQTLSM